MKTIFTVLDGITHQLNAPLASAKSYVYLATRAAGKNDTAKLDTHLKALDEKLDLIARRVDLIVTALRLQNVKVQLTYEFFPLSTLTGNESHTIEVMADKSLLTSAFTYAQELVGSTEWSIITNKNVATASLAVQAKPESEDKDIRTEFIEKAIILHHAVKQHGGTLEETEKELKNNTPC